MLKPIEDDVDKVEVKPSGKNDEHLDEDHVAEDEPRYSKLIEAINRFHPRNDKMEKFSICDELGAYPMCCGKQKDITLMAKEIGVGPTMFLLSTKHLAYFFVFLSILNIPIYMFFNTSNQSGVDCTLGNL